MVLLFPGTDIYGQIYSSEEKAVPFGTAFSSLEYG